MSISRLPSGRWRAQIHVPGKGNVSVANIIGGPKSFSSKREAKAAREAARARIGTTSDITVQQFAHRWTSDKLFARPRESTNVTNRWRIKGFVDKYGSLRLAQVDDAVVAEWLAGGTHAHTIPALRAMWNDAMSPKAGRVTDRNPWAALGLKKGRPKAWRLDENARKALDSQAALLTPPSFATYLRFGCLTALRPSELDALKLEDVDTEAGEIHVRRQWNHRIGAMSEPKYGPYVAALVDEAREILQKTPRDHDAPWAFLTLRGHHYTPSTRSHHWNRVRCGAQLGDVTLYMATRHYFAWYSLNVLRLPPHIIAEQLGHRDGGKLIVSTYGHPSADVARDRIREAYRDAANVRVLPTRREAI